MLDSHPLSNLPERPGLAWEPRLDRGLDRSNLSFVNRYRRLAHSDDEGNPGDQKNWEPIQCLGEPMSPDCQKNPFPITNSVTQPTPNALAAKHAVQRIQIQQSRPRPSPVRQYGWSNRIVA